MTRLDDNNYPPRNLKTDEEIIDYIYEHQVKCLHGEGYEWLWSVYMPTLARIVDADEVDDETIAGNFYAVGDVHDFNESPRAAITYYKRALVFDPEMSSAHREIANMYHRLGFIDAAIHHSDQALTLWPDEKNAVADREYIDADKNDPSPYYEKSDTPAALAKEALSRQAPKDAIQLLEGLDDLESLRILTWAYGADENVSAYLASWEALVIKMKATPTREDMTTYDSNLIDFTWGDIFYMPDKVWGEANIWKIWKESGLGFTGLTTDYDGLDDLEGKLPIDKNYSKLSTSDNIAQKIEYHFYDRSNDLEGLKSIQTKYPNWVELNEKIEILKNQL